MPPKRNYRKAKAPAMQKIARKEVKKALKKEIETKDYTGVIVVSADIPSTGIGYSLLTNPSTGTSIVSGTNEVNYIGSTINPMKLDLRLLFTVDDDYNNIRCVIIQWKGQAPTLMATILSNVFTFTGSILAPFSPFRNDYESQYRVLYDSTITLDQQDNHAKYRRIKLGKKRKVKFKDTVGVVEDGELFILFMSDSIGIVHPRVIGSWKTWFTDA